MHVYHVLEILHIEYDQFSWNGKQHRRNKRSSKNKNVY